MQKFFNVLRSKPIGLLGFVALSGGERVMT
jgi:hypothetical protein